MNIGEARRTYSQQLQSYRTKQSELSNRKKELEEKINRGNGDNTVLKNEAAIIELQYNAVSEKREEYQSYMDKLLEQQIAIENLYVSEQQSDAYEEAATDLQKIIVIARRIMRGEKVPSKDEKKLMEYDSDLYQLAKSAGMMVKNKKRKEHKSLWEDEEKKEYADPTEEAEKSEAFAAGPELISVSDTMDMAVAEAGSVGANVEG